VLTPTRTWMWRSQEPYPQSCAPGKAGLRPQQAPRSRGQPPRRDQCASPGSRGRSAQASGASAVAGVRPRLRPWHEPSEDERDFALVRCAPDFERRARTVCSATRRKSGTTSRRLFDRRALRRGREHSTQWRNGPGPLVARTGADRNAAAGDAVDTSTARSYQ
jgi:hypothetical protein